MRLHVLLRAFCSYSFVVLQWQDVVAVVVCLFGVGSFAIALCCCSSRLVIATFLLGYRANVASSRRVRGCLSVDRPLQSKKTFTFIAFARKNYNVTPMQTVASQLFAPSQRFSAVETARPRSQLSQPECSPPAS